MSLLNLDEIIDLYSEPVSFIYKKKKKYSSACGGVVSIIVIILISFYLGYLLYHMFQRGQPYLFTLDSYSDIPSPIYVWKDKSYDNKSLTRDWIPEEKINEIGYWYTTLGIRNNIGNNPSLIPIDPTYMSFEILQIKINNETISEVPLNFLKCPKFGRFDPIYYESLLLNQTYCLNDYYELKGIPGKEGSAWVELRVSMCNGLPTCRPQNEILAWFQNIQIEFYFQTRLMNTTNTSNDLVTSSIEQRYWDMLPSYSKYAVCEIGIDFIKSYDGYLPDFIQSSFVNTYAFMIRGFKDYISDINDNKNLFIFRFQSSRNKVEVQRRFPKDILTQLALIGGIAGIIYNLGWLCVYLFSWFRLIESLINDFYNVITPNNNKYIKRSFTQFLNETYNDLMKKYYYIHQQANTKEVKLELGEKENKGMIVELDKYKITTGRENDNNIENNNDKLSLMESHIERINSEEMLIENIFNVIDDEGLTHLKRANAIELYFTLKRIESMFNITKEERDNLLNKVVSQKIENFDFYEHFLSKRNKTDLYEIEKAVYNVFIFTCYDKIYFSPCEMFGKIFCSCCFRKKKEKIVKDIFNESKLGSPANLKVNGRNKKSENNDEEDINETSNTLKKFKIFDGSLLKLGMDFDIVSVLKTVQNLENFKQVFFDSSERGLFESVANPHIKVTDINEDLSVKKQKEAESDIFNLNEFRHFLMNSFSKGKLSVVDKNLLMNMGMEIEEVKKFAKMVEEAKLKNEFKLCKKDGLNKIVSEKEVSVLETDNINNEENETEEVPELKYSHELYKEINEKFGFK